MEGGEDRYGGRVCCRRECNSNDLVGHIRLLQSARSVSDAADIFNKYSPTATDLSLSAPASYHGSGRRSKTSKESIGAEPEVSKRHQSPETFSKPHHAQRGLEGVALSHCTVVAYTRQSYRTCKTMSTSIHSENIRPYVSPRCDETHFKRQSPISNSFSEGSGLRHSFSKS